MAQQLGFVTDENGMLLLAPLEAHDGAGDLAHKVAAAVGRFQVRQGGVVPPEVEALLDRLTDPGFPSVFVVPPPEATPIHEAAALKADLRRAGIEPTAW